MIRNDPKLIRNWSETDPKIFEITAEESCRKFSNHDCIACRRLSIRFTNSKYIIISILSQPCYPTRRKFARRKQQKRRRIIMRLESRPHAKRYSQYSSLLHTVLECANETYIPTRRRELPKKRPGENEPRMMRNNEAKLRWCGCLSLWYV